MEQLGLTFSAERRIFTVSELTFVIRGLLENAFENVWVSGELSNTRHPSSGHYYFTLKDGESQLKCVCFRQNARYLKIKPSDGLEVVARGRIGVYEARGEYQLYVESIEPVGYGALQLAFEQLKKKLAAEGLFDDDRKRPLPLLPRRIGIVTSSSGAAVADMIRILERRCPGLHIRLYPAKVQGEGAAAEIVRGIEHFSSEDWADVVIIGRGGGSLEDLWAFNEEPVARAIAASRVPIVSAVGHQTDFTIADFTADLRAPTPSAAAELVAPDLAELLRRVRTLRDRATQSVRYRIARSGRRLLQAGVEQPAALIRRRVARLWQRNDELEHRLAQTILRRLRTAEQRYRDRQHSLAQLDLRLRLAQTKTRLQGLDQRLAPAIRRLLALVVSRHASLDRELESLSPLAILERGYAIVSDPSGAAIRSSDQVEPGDRLAVKLHHGRLDVDVKSTAP